MNVTKNDKEQNTMDRRSLLKALALTPVASVAFPAFASDALKPASDPVWNSERVNALFSQFGSTGKMPPELGRWLSDPKAQKIDPYEAFDGVYNVGVNWVSAWLIKTPAGPVLVDTVHEPFVDQLLANIKACGVNPADLKMVFVTHGHFDYCGGMKRLKEIAPKARFVMTKRGWDEANVDAKRSHQGGRNTFTMIPQDLVAKDGDTFAFGSFVMTVLETPGHTWGTASYVYPVRDGDKTYRAITVGGLGLNAITGPDQVGAYIDTVKRIRRMVEDPVNPISVHLSAFSNGLMEKRFQLPHTDKSTPHPLVAPAAFVKELDVMESNAMKRLAIEKARKA
jgi:metallo-beta-lactamase class B